LAQFQISIAANWFHHPLRSRHGENRGRLFFSFAGRRRQRKDTCR